MITRKVEQEFEEIRYVSEDEMEFRAEKDCKEYEESKEGKIAISFYRIPKVEVNCVDLGIPYNTEYFEAYMIRPQNMDEITTLNLFIETITGENKFFTPLAIGKTFLINLGECRDWVDVYQLDKYTANLRSNLSDYIAQIDKNLGKDEEK